MQHMFIISEPMLHLLQSGSSMHLTLPHLYEKHPEYVDYYRLMSENGDWVMQDNSLFELKEVVAGDLFKYAEMIKASELVVPEVLRDREASVAAVNEFFRAATAQRLKDYKYCCVLQASSYEDLALYYEYVDKQLDGLITTIGIPFDLEYDAYGDRSEAKQKAGFNRFSVIRRLVGDQIWNAQKTHHLFGLFNPAELTAYKAEFPAFIWNSIRSNDSSGCFWHSLYGMRYYANCGLLYRKIESHMDFSVSFTHQEQYNTFWRNRDMMLEFVRGCGGEALRSQYKRWSNERPSS